MFLFFGSCVISRKSIALTSIASFLALTPLARDVLFSYFLSFRTSSSPHLIHVFFLLHPASVGWRGSRSNESLQAGILKVIRFAVFATEIHEIPSQTKTSFLESVLCNVGHRLPVSRVFTKANVRSANKRTPVAAQPPFLQQKQIRCRLGGQAAKLRTLPTYSASRVPHAQLPTCKKRSKFATATTNAVKSLDIYYVKNCSTLSTCGIAANDTLQSAWQSWQL